MKRYGRKRMNRKQQISKIENDRNENSEIVENKKSNNKKSNNKKSKYDLHKSRSNLQKKKKNKTVRFSEIVHKTIITDIPDVQEPDNNDESKKKDWDITFNVEFLD